MHVGQRHHRADRPGAAHHQVGVGERRGQPVQARRGGRHPRLGHPRGQPLRPVRRTVQHVDPTDAGAGQVGDGERTHRARPDHHRGLAPQGAQLGFGDAQGHRHHRGAGGVDRGFGMHPLAHRQCPLGQLVQHPADGTVGLGGGVGAADLTEHLLLADHRRIQPAGHREQMLDGGLAVADVGVLGQVTHRHAGEFGQRLPDHRKPAVEGVHHGVHLDAVAGREQHGLGDQGDCSIWSTILT